MTDQAEPIGAEGAVVDIKSERTAFQTWWRMWCPDQGMPSVTSHIFDAWLARARTPDPKAAGTRAKWESLIPAEAFWQVGHDGEGPDPSLIKARIFDPMTMDRPIVGLGKTADSAVRSALSLTSSTSETTLVQNHSSVDAGLAELIDALQAATVEEGATVFEHSAEEIGIMVMESHAIVLAAVSRARGGAS